MPVRSCSRLATAAAAPDAACATAVRDGDAPPKDGGNDAGCALGSSGTSEEEGAMPVALLDESGSRSLSLDAVPAPAEPTPPLLALRTSAAPGTARRGARGLCESGDTAPEGAMHRGRLVMRVTG